MNCKTLNFTNCMMTVMTVMNIVLRQEHISKHVNVSKEIQDDVQCWCLVPGGTICTPGVHVYTGKLMG